MSEERGSAGEVPDWLVEAQRRGFVGPGPLPALVEHSLGFAEVVEGLLGGPPADLVDLGSGGGVPGLTLATRWLESRITLVEGSARRAGFLVEVTERSQTRRQVETLWRRAEELGRDPSWREAVSVVVARSFGSPAVTTECAAPLLRVGGWLVVSEPPVPAGASPSAGRWPADGLSVVGLEPVGLMPSRGYGYQAIRKVGPTPDRYPRRVGIPAKRPIY